MKPHPYPDHPDHPDQTESAHSSQFDVTQPARPLRNDANQPLRRMHRSASEPPQHVRRTTSQRPAPLPQRHTKPTNHFPHQRRWSCSLSFLFLTLVVCLGGLLAFALLPAPSPMNVLILGVDRRRGEGNIVRADTILLLRADPGNHRLAILSIPRDLWVTIPGRGEARINTAHIFGELETPGSGPARTAETITYNFGVPVHHSLRLDFDAFRKVVDAAGGVDIDVPAPIIDDAYPTEDYGTMRIEIPAGSQHMDAETALQYARSRHGSSDFDRAARQQQILEALIKKLTKPSGWHRIPGVYQAYQNATDTDLSLRDLALLALTWQRTGQDGLQKIVIDRTLTTPFLTPQGAQVLLPRWDLIHPLVQAQFAQ